MVLELLAQNWAWVLFLALFGAGLVLMRRLPNTQVMGRILFKINSTRGIRMMDREGRRHSRFWRFVGDLALVALFGGLGTAYVAAHSARRKRSALAAALAFLATFAYAGPNVIAFFPFAAHLSPSLLSIGAGLLAAALAYKLVQRAGKRASVLLVFGLAFLFFGSPYILSYIASGSLYWLAVGASVGTIGLPAILIANLAIHAGSIAAGASAQPGINIGYPDVEDGVPVLKYAGTDLSIPLFPDILLAIIILLALHEGFHGLVSRAQGIRIKNTGLLFASIVPMGAFVEPDEKQFKKEKPLKRLRVYAVGSFANIFVIALAAFLAGNALVGAGAVRSEGFVVDYVVANSSADGLISPGEVISEVGAKSTPTFADFSEVMAGREPGENLTLATGNRTVSLVLGEAPDNPGQGFVGLGRKSDPILTIYSPGMASSRLEPSAGTSAFNLLKWVFFLNLMIGLINLLPVKPLDGGYVYEGFFDWLEERLPLGRRLHLAALFSQGFMLLILAILIINMSPYLF